MAAQSGTGVPTSREANGTDEVADLFRALGRQIWETYEHRTVRAAQLVQEQLQR